MHGRCGCTEPRQTRPRSEPAHSRAQSQEPLHDAAGGRDGLSCERAAAKLNDRIPSNPDRTAVIAHSKNHPLVREYRVSNAILLITLVRGQPIGENTWLSSNCLARSQFFQHLLVPRRKHTQSTADRSQPRLGALPACPTKAPATAVN